MQTSVAKKGMSTNGPQADVASMINKEFRKGYEIPYLDYQKFGIQARLLWPSRNQILRIIPGYDAATGNIFRQNINGEGGIDEDVPLTEYLSDTFTVASVVPRFGLCSNPLITDYAPGSADAERWAGNTVIHQFCRTIKNSIADSSKVKYKPRFVRKPIRDWNVWCGFNNDRGTLTIDLDRPTFLMQALVFHMNGQDNMADYANNIPLTDENGDVQPLLYVVGISHKASVDALQTALVKPQNRNLPLDAATNNEYGPMAEADGCKLFLNTCNDPATGHPILKPSVQAASKGWTPTPYPLTEDQIHELWHPWDSILHYMTATEQLELCAKYFGADTVNYVIGEDPAMRDLEIPEHIRAQGLGRYATVSDGGRIELTTAKPRTTGFGASGLSAAAAKPATRTQDALGSVQASAGVDMDRLRERVAKMRAASGLQQHNKPATAVNQAADAASLLDDDLMLPLGE